MNKQGQAITAECIKETLREQGNVLSPYVVAQCIEDLQSTIRDLREIMQVICNHCCQPVANAKPPTRTWTTEKPTKPGYYWFKDDAPIEPVIMRMERDFFDGRKLVVDESGADVSGGQWYGPVDSPPQE